MDSLPNDVICNIFRNATVPVDTYLAFRKYGVTPNKVKIPKELQCSLAKICKRRTSGYDQYKRHMELTSGWSFITRLDKAFLRVNTDTTVEMEVVERDGVLQYSFMSMRLPANLVGFSMRRGDSYDMHSGEEVPY